jgi:hypothetical protein
LQRHLEFSITTIVVTSASFPTPFIITIGVPKGGDCKSWLAFNLASRLGFWGYDVLVVDSNPQHDLWSDHEFLMQKGIYPRFDVKLHDPLDSKGDQNSHLDLRDQEHRDFIVFDTSQYVQLRSTAWAWTHCDLMLMPVTPNTTQRRNYDTALQLFHAMPGQRPPLVVVPCKVDVLKNSTPQKQLEDMLVYLNTKGCITPSFDSSNQIPQSQLMACQDTRWVFSETEFNDKPKILGREFLLKVDISLSWIRSLIEVTYGRFPAPRLPVLDFYDKNRVLKQLSAECLQKSANFVANNLNNVGGEEG